MWRSLVALTALTVTACSVDPPRAGTLDAAGPDAQPTPDGSSGPDAPPVVNPDAPNIDAMPPIPDGIAEARAAADGTGLTLAINNAIVTYLKPQLGSTTNDPAGFTIQASPTGPALFVSIDPATLTPPAAVGDVVSFTITTMGTVRMQRRAFEISNYTRTSQGANVGALSQNVSNATDLVGAIDNYDSELVTVTGTFFENFASSGTGFERSGFTTAGIAGDVNLQLRAPATLVAALDMTMGCQITATNIPVGRFDAQTQLTVFSASDFVMSGCAAPVVTAVSALSSTSVRVTFSRNILPASVVAGGSQFTLDNGVTATAAVAAGKTVTVTTSAQAVGTTYGVTVANTVTDLQASSIGTPNTGSFPGFVTPAVVRINEVNANIANGCDLIELRVVTGGSMTNFKMRERNGSVGELNFTFPNLVVQTNDLIVIHLNSTSTTCNPSGATSETTTKTDQPVAMFARNFDTAFDFWNDDTGLLSPDNVFTLRDANDAIIDAVLISNDPAGNANIGIASETAAAAVGAANQWDPALATYIDGVFRMHGVDDLDLTGTATTGTSIQRLNNADTNNKADWTTGAGAASTFGALNPGQTAF